MECLFHEISTRELTQHLFLSILAAELARCGWELVLLMNSEAGQPSVVMDL